MNERWKLLQHWPPSRTQWHRVSLFCSLPHTVAIYNRHFLQLSLECRDENDWKLIEIFDFDFFFFGLILDRPFSQLNLITKSIVVHCITIIVRIDDNILSIYIIVKCFFFSFFISHNDNQIIISNIDSIQLNVCLMQSYSIWMYWICITALSSDEMDDFKMKYTNALVISCDFQMSWDFDIYIYFAHTKNKKKLIKVNANFGSTLLS